MTNVGQNGDGTHSQDGRDDAGAAERWHDDFVTCATPVARSASSSAARPLSQATEDDVEKNAASRDSSCCTSGPWTTRPRPTQRRSAAYVCPLQNGTQSGTR